MKDLDVFRAALTRGKAIPAWQLAYLLARLSPPSPTHDPPITIPTDERPPLVIAALRWVSERAAEEPCSDEDEGRRQRDWVEYFVRPEVALSMLDEASQEANVWLAMPHVRVIDAAVLVARDVPQAPALLHTMQSSLQPWRGTVLACIAPHASAPKGRRKPRLRPAVAAQFWTAAAASPVMH